MVDLEARMQSSCKTCDCAMTRSIDCATEADVWNLSPSCAKKHDEVVAVKYFR